MVYRNSEHFSNIIEKKTKNKDKIINVKIRITRGNSVDRKIGNYVVRHVYGLFRDSLPAFLRIYLFRLKNSYR